MSGLPFSNGGFGQAEADLLSGLTATASELNAAAGTGVSSTELDLLDGAIAGTAVASKALALGTNKNVDTLVIADSGLYLGSGAGTAVTATAAELNNAADVSANAVAAGAALTLTLANHAGKTILLDTAAGSTVTLPTSTGSGAVYNFVIKTVATSNSHIVKVANATDVINGLAFTVSDGAAAVLGYIAAATDDTITLNRTTTGSVSKGEFIRIVDAAAGFFLAQVFTASTGTEATPFSATV